MKRILPPLLGKFILVFLGILIASNILSVVIMVLIGGGFPADTVKESAPLLKTVLIRNSVLLLLIGTLFIFIAARIIVKPLRQLSDAAKKVANGDLSANIPLENKRNRNNELYVLVENFNTMVEALSNNEYLHKNFVANVSHEFKTPITAIQGYAELLGSPSIEDDKRIKYADIIFSQCTRLAKLSSNLLRLSELEHDSAKISPEEFNVSEQIRDAVLLFQKEWETKQLELELELEDLVYTGDKQLLYQVWANLIGNAIKFSQSNVLLHISAKRKIKNGHQLIITISDTGIGMTEYELEHIFDRFYTADESRNIQGTGLGLPIVKKIIELHGGALSVKSKVDLGSSFTVLL